MDKIATYRQQLKGTSGKYRWKEVKEALGSRRTTGSFLYAENYDPEISTVKKLADAGLLNVGIPLELEAYQELLRPFTMLELIALTEYDPVNLRLNALVELGQGTYQRLTLKQAAAVVAAVEAFNQGKVVVQAAPIDPNKFLQENYAVKGAAWCAEQLQVTAVAVRTRASRLGLRYTG